MSAPVKYDVDGRVMIDGQSVVVSHANGLAFTAAGRLAVNNLGIFDPSRGYEPPVAYAAGLAMLDASQTVEYLGQVYAPIIADLPFTTSGTFETSSFRLIQGVAGADLLAPGGALMVGYDNTSSGLSATTVQGAIDEIESTTLKDSQASLDPGAGKIPVARADSYIDAGWLEQLDNLEGVEAQSLHRSPNAITALFVYDTSKDSDGGAWTEKCQHTSWYNEPINGKWLGAHASEAAARAVSGATTGDYFQLTTNGQFFSLNAGSGTTQTFRGNKRDFPRLAAIVAEAGSVTIYDLTESDRPMWMRCATTAQAVDSAGFMQLTFFTSGSLYALNGVLSVGSSANTAASGLAAINFPTDSLSRAAGSRRQGLPVSKRQSGDPFPVSSAGAIVDVRVNAVAMTVLPDAPVDPVSGLPVPTIAVGTAGGLFVIRHDGVVTNPSSAETRNVSFDAKNALVAQIGENNRAYRKSIPPYTSIITYVGGPLAFNITNALSNVSFNKHTGRSVALARINAGNGVAVIRDNDKVNSAALASVITNLFNTGHQPGDIRRTYLSDVAAGSVTAPELVDTANDSAAWTKYGNNTVEQDGDAVKITYIDTTSGAVMFLTEAGGLSANMGTSKKYEISFQAKVNTGTVNFNVISATFISVSSTSYATYRVVVDGRSDASAFVRAEAMSAGEIFWVKNISVKEVVADRSYKASGILPYGTLTRAAVATDASLVAYEGFSAANYLQEPYSADLDFGTGEWGVSAWANIPAVLPESIFPVVGSELWVSVSPTITTGTGSYNTVTQTMTGLSSFPRFGFNLGLQIGRRYVVQGQLSGDRAAVVDIQTTSGTAPNGARILNYNSTTGTFSGVLENVEDGNLWFRTVANSATFTVTIDNISVKEVEPARIADRAYSSGASIRLGVNAGGGLEATAFDGTTTRTVTTTAAYNTATWIKPEAVYTTDGTLAIRVNGQEVATARGAPLLTLNNSDAVLTIGNSYALGAPFPGKLALVKLSATVPTPEQSVWMYEQEKQLFRDNAKCVLPDSGALVDLAYDEATDKWIAASAANISEWSGLIRTNVIAAPAGSYSKLASGGGVTLSGRTTTSPGVDVTIPAYNLREELIRRAEAAARLNANLATFDYNGGFTGSTTDTSTAVTSVAGLSYPASYIGALVTGAGIPADTVVAGVSGTTIYLSKAATATATGVQIAFRDFALPVGYEAKRVSVAGSAQQEGATKAYTKLFDGFKETVRFGVAPAHDAWVQIQATRSQA